MFPDLQVVFREMVPVDQAHLLAKKALFDEVVVPGPQADLRKPRALEEENVPMKFVTRYFSAGGH